MDIVEDGLSGIEILERIRKGHMVRRACWVRDYLIRITNEVGFDKDGNVEFSKRVALYTHATNGNFMHFGWSSQPFSYQHTPRSGEGLSMIFENDWEDYGFISSDDFNALALKLKDSVRDECEKYLSDFHKSLIGG